MRQAKIQVVGQRAVRGKDRVLPSVCADTDREQAPGNARLELQEDDENKSRYWKDICPEMAIDWRKGNGRILRN